MILFLKQQVAWRWRSSRLLNVVVVAVADGLFGLCGSESRDELFIGTRPLQPSHPDPSTDLTPFPVPDKLHVACGRKGT